MEFLIENGPKLISMATSLIGAFAVLATMTKNKSDNKVANILMKIVNLLGFNFGQSKNA